MKTSRSIAMLALAIALAAVPGEGRSQNAEPPRTATELSGYARYTSYDEMWTYLDGLQRASSSVRLGVYGVSGEGRELPYLVFSRPSITRPWEAWTLGRPIVVLAANVHGQERMLRESVLILAREFATTGTPMNDALDDLTVLVVPQINPDGFSAEPRPTRGNAAGIDLNRDYMKLEHPEIQAYVSDLLLPWAPHLVVDGHEGAAYPYNINYQCPSHAGQDPRITELCDERLFPAVDAALEAEGFRSWFYQRGTETRWDGGGFEPRIGRNYGGFANMVGVLFEAGPSQSIEDGVASGLIAYRAVIEWSRDNAELLAETVREARLEAVALGAGPSGDVPTDMEYGPEPESVTYLIPVRNGDARGVMEIRSDSLMKRPVVTESRTRPWAYVVPADADEALDLLRAHGVQTEELREPVQVSAVAYRIREVGYESIYDHPAAVRVDRMDEVPLLADLAAGSFIVRIGQMQGRVASHLLEPETTDGVVYWNRMDAWLPSDAAGDDTAGDDASGDVPSGVDFFPIYKLMRPTALPTTLVPPAPIR